MNEPKRLRQVLAELRAKSKPITDLNDVEIAAVIEAMATGLGSTVDDGMMPHNVAVVVDPIRRSFAVFGSKATERAFAVLHGLAQEAEVADA